MPTKYSLHDLQLRIARAMAGRRGIRLSDSDLNLLAISGAYDALVAAATQELKEVSAERQAARRNPDGGTSGTG